MRSFSFMADGEGWSDFLGIGSLPLLVEILSIRGIFRDNGVNICQRSIN